MKKKNITLKHLIFFLATALCITTLLWIFFTTINKKPIKIGILHSLTGPMAVYEKTAVDATILAIEEVNKNGGVLGKQIKPIIADGKSDAATFAQEAQRLISQEKVAVIFGCWTSTDRKAVKPIIEEHNNLLFFPVQHEGLESSHNIVYTSTTPNQQAIPAATWCLHNLGKKIFLVGSDELFTRATNEIIKDTITAFNGETVAEEYLAPNSNDVMNIIEKIKEKKPEVIINTIIGPTNLTFFTELRKAGISSEKIPTMSLCIDEPELQKYGAQYMAGDYSTWSHFQSIDRIENKKFVSKVKQRFGQEYVISDAMEAAYFGVYLWLQAVNRAQTTQADTVIKNLNNQAFDAPEGIIYIDDKSLHTWSFSSVGKIRSDKQFTILWNSEKAISPLIYPPFKTRAEWDALLQKWYKQWGNKWSSD